MPFILLIPVLIQMPNPFGLLKILNHLPPKVSKTYFQFLILYDSIIIIMIIIIIIIKVDVSGAGTDLGTGGMQTKILAASLATAAGVNTVIIMGNEYPFISIFIIV